MKEDFDFIIIGSGVAGNVCAFELQKKGYSCMILEKTISRCEKVCGGGVPYKALQVLQRIGMSLDELYARDVSIIKGDVVYEDGNQVESIYDNNCKALGCRRTDFDDFLLAEAQKYGAKIRWGANIKEIEAHSNGYLVDKYQSKKVVIAAGARGIYNKYYHGQSMGISSQIMGEGSFLTDRFTYFYLTNSGDKYFWIFPVGKNIWNVGLWFKIPEYSMKETFLECWNSIIKPNFANYTILQKPTAEFCGNVSLNLIEKFPCDAIGDYSGTNNILNGGGIYRAIKSALKYTDKIGRKST